MNGKCGCINTNYAISSRGQLDAANALLSKKAKTKQTFNVRIRIILLSFLQIHALHQFPLQTEFFSVSCFELRVNQCRFHLIQTLFRDESVIFEKKKCIKQWIWKESCWHCDEELSTFNGNLRSPIKCRCLRWKFLLICRPRFLRRLFIHKMNKSIRALKTFLSNKWK